MGSLLRFQVGSLPKTFFRWTPHPVIVTIRDINDYIRVFIFLLYHYYRVGDPPKAFYTTPLREEGLKGSLLSLGFTQAWHNT